MSTAVARGRGWMVCVIPCGMAIDPLEYLEYAELFGNKESAEVTARRLRSEGNRAWVCEARGWRPIVRHRRPPSLRVVK